MFDKAQYKPYKLRAVTDLPYCVVSVRFNKLKCFGWCLTNEIENLKHDHNIRQQHPLCVNFGFF